MTSEQEALLNAIESQPDEWSGKMIYADWLDENGYPEEAAFIRAFDPTSPGVRMDREKFGAAIIAQDDDGDYGESGYVAAVFVSGGVEIAVLAQYSHCSCYGTWSAIEGKDGFAKFTWVGSVPALIDMAKREADPVLPDRPIDAKDYDADHLRKVYADVLAWNFTREVAPACGKPKLHQRAFCECCPKVISA